jgi:hypothetical protein
MSKITKGVLHDPMPLYEVINGERYPTYVCAACDGGFEEKDGKVVVWCVDGVICCSEACAEVYDPLDDPRLRDDQ